MTFLKGRYVRVGSKDEVKLAGRKLNIPPLYTLQKAIALKGSYLNRTVFVGGCYKLYKQFEKEIWSLCKNVRSMNINQSNFIKYHVSTIY